MTEQLEAVAELPRRPPTPSASEERQAAARRRRVGPTGAAAAALAERFDAEQRGLTQSLGDAKEKRSGLESSRGRCCRRCRTSRRASPTRSRPCSPAPPPGDGEQTQHLRFCAWPAGRDLLETDVQRRRPSWKRRWASTSRRWSSDKLVRHLLGQRRQDRGRSRWPVASRSSPLNQPIAAGKRVGSGDAQDRATGRSRSSPPRSTWSAIPDWLGPGRLASAGPDLHLVEDLAQALASACPDARRLPLRHRDGRVARGRRPRPRRTRSAGRRAA